MSEGASTRFGDSSPRVAFTGRTRGPELQFQLLGQLGVRADGRDIDLGSPKQRSVLAVLLLHANEIVPTDRIIELVWGDQAPRTADHSVQIYVSELRKALSNGTVDEVIETRPPGYVMNVPPDSIDAKHFESLVREGLAAIRSDDPTGGRGKLEEALASWIGEPLADFAYDDFAQGYVRSLVELRSDALEALAQLELSQGNNDDARNRARLAIDADPLREMPRRVMMLALYRTGRQAEALRHYAAYHALLVDELGIEPSEQMRDLEESILLQDPSLDERIAVTADDNPYRGLRAFSEDDADVYFGRESLVTETLERLDSGRGFVSIVGPSGSGKSSAARAGAVPVLRARGDTVVVFEPGSRPLWELAGALDRAGLGSRASILRRLEASEMALVEIVTRPVVLVVDQFEEVFTLASEDVGVRFAELVANAIRDHETPLRVVATLRADYYDRPLTIPALAGVFSESVVSVKPMTPPEIEQAVIQPAAARGVRVEPGLLAQLIADMGDEPGALPLLQYTLFEMFEREHDRLTLSDYESLGGINGALTGGADQLLAELPPDGRAVAEQLMMRMVRKGRALSTSRPVLVRDLVDLGVDRVELQDVLEAFGSRRLITFDRDASGAAVVEMAHEYLISEWPQMENWLDAHTEDLDRLQETETAVAEWATSNRSDDYLLRGDRLRRFEAWYGATSLRLTSTEREFIEASIDLRERESRDRLEQAETEVSLRRSARRRLWAFGGAVAALTAAVTWLVITLQPAPPPDMVVWFTGRGDGAFGDLIGSAVDQVEGEYGLHVVELTEDISQIDRIRAPIDAGAPLVMAVAAIVDIPFEQVMADHPDTSFVQIDCVAGFVPEHSSCIGVKNEQMGFLAGVAAASVTETGRVGFLGGVDIFVLHDFQAGFEQGVAWVDPDIEVDVLYLAPWFGAQLDMGAFNSPAFAEIGARTLFAEGSDVVYVAAGTAGVGVAQAAASYSGETGRTVWAIESDVDNATSLDVSGQSLYGDLAATLVPDMQEHILTSIVKRVDVGILAAVAQFEDSGQVGNIVLDIPNGGIDYVTTGGHITPSVDILEEAKAAVDSGTVVLSTTPTNRPRLLRDVVGAG